MAFNLAYCQSRPTFPVSNDPANNELIPSGNPPAPVFQPWNDYGNIMSEPDVSRSEQIFQPGIIITKEGDTLAGLVKYAYTGPSDKVTYRANLIASDSVFSIYKIRSIITQFVYLANIPFAGKEKMMPWLAVGKINLYTYAKYYTESFPEITYVLEKGKDHFIYINKKGFNAMMKHAFFDTPDLLKKIGKKGYRFDDMVRIIRDYNKRFQ